MKWTFLYPCDPFENQKVDSMFQAEYDVMKNLFNVQLINVDNLDSAKNYKLLRNNCIYRGWMLTENQYKKLELGCNGLLIVSTKDYLSSHYLSNWYEELKELTPKTIITSEDNAIKDFENSGWNTAFIKDYVKSLKTGKGSIIDSSEDIARAIKDMYHYRGYIEGGIILRETHKFKTDSEKRFFVINGNVFSPTEMISSQEVELVKKVMQRQSNKFFFSIDIVEDIHGKSWLVEIGDGQVSDYVGWEVENFAKIFLCLENNYKIKSKIKLT